MKKTTLTLLGAFAAATAVGAKGVDEVVKDTTITLQEVSVRANFSDERQTPLNITTITPQQIRLHATDPNYVGMMQGVPGVYATASTGSYGDATLNMRGFKQDNIAIMLNGIPIQGLTSGSMYWNNWMGLADATWAVQLQKGMGASMLADCAMGGMVNIITRTGSGQPHSSFALSTTETGLTKGVINYSSGSLRNGWAVDLMLSYTKGHGYVECSDVETMSYMLTVSKLLGAHNTLVFTALGSPETHDQRNTELSAEEVERYGTGYSKNWGLLYGKPYSIGRNHYYKPYFTLQHILDGERFEMKNSVYLAIADGGGRSTYAQPGAKSIISHQTPDGHIDFDAVIKENEEAGSSRNIMIDYLSGHTQAGAITTADWHLGQGVTIASGLQYQYYNTWSKMKVLDLLGGESWYDATTKQQVTTGDYTGARYGRTTHHASAFVQARYTSDRLNANVGVTAFNGNYQRQNDITDEKSEWAHAYGASVKGGVLYHLTTEQQPVAHALYLNAAYNSRLPYAGTYLASSNLSITNDIVNEKNILTEVGWKARWRGGECNVSAYATWWNDKTLTVSLAKRANEAVEKYNISGLNAFHCGVELDLRQRVTSWLDAKLYAMTASWKWKNTGTAIMYDSFSGDELSTFAINCDGLHVGDAPQTQLGGQLDANIGHGVYAHLAWQYNARMYADFQPSSRITTATGTGEAADAEENVPDAYRLPEYHLLDATIGWRTRLNDGISLNIFATCNNLLNTSYIERGTDGATHDINSFRGYWGAPRTVSIGMRMGF